MSKSIKLHPEYGLNPTISQCILCGKDKNELLLLGNAFKGQAPMHMITSIEPCDECRAKYLSTGVMLVEATGDDKKPVPTGRIVVLKDEAFQKVFNVPIPASHIAFMDTTSFHNLGLDKVQAGVS